MLHIIRGRAGSGKTDYLHKLILESVNDDSFSPILIVPEQFSFITERSLLKKIGAYNFNNKVTVTSFSRLALTGFQTENCDTHTAADNGIRCVLMLKALESLEGRLTLYDNAAKNTGLLDSLVSFRKELKLCGVSLDSIRDFLAVDDNIKDKNLLKTKLNELILIYEAYDAVLSNSYYDEIDLLEQFNQKALTDGFFENKTVFVDAFRAFSCPELECIKIALRQAKDVYISFCSDEIKSESSPFKFIDAFEAEIQSAAKENNVPIALPYFCSGSSFSDAIAFIEKYIFTDVRIITEKDGDSNEDSNEESDEHSIKPFSGDASSVSVVECADADDECRFVACEIKKLLRSGKYRCKDIAVIERSNGVYKKFLCDMLKRFDIPVFNDNRRPLVSELVFVHIISALECVADNFQIESVFRYLKTSLSGLTLTEVSVLEKYALLWDINGKAWSQPFTQHPAGYGVKMTEAAEKQLAFIESIRKKAVAPLFALKEKTADKTGLEISQAVFEFLEQTKVPDRLMQFAEKLENDELPTEAKRKEASWDALVQLLETTARLTENEYISLKRWFAIFRMLADKKDIGEIPQGLDEVTVGSADRIRTDGLKVVFLVGVNLNEFPLLANAGGVLTDADRQALVNDKVNLGIRPSFADCVSEEQFITYCALTAASEKLYLSYKTISAGAECMCSDLVSDIISFLPTLNKIDWIKAEPIEKIESIGSAFTEFARCFTDNSALRNTLYKFFADNQDYSGRLSALGRAVTKTPIQISSPETAKALFGRDLRLSATKINTYSSCPFSYFCKFGIKAHPLKKAEFDARQTGTLIHKVLQILLEKYKNDFVNVGENELRELAEGVLAEYLNSCMGGSDNKSARFMFLYNRLIKTLMIIIGRLKVEFSNCDFEPCDFELEIGSEKLPAYTLPLEDGSVEITGSIDRVDIYEKDGIKYVRVIDYKSGKKTFKLSKILRGLDVQMVLYLMALVKNGKQEYENVTPAGVLYMPSRIGYAKYAKKRVCSQEEIDASRLEIGKLSGMVLQSPVVFNAMGIDRVHNYFPVNYNAKGECDGDAYTPGDFSLLSSHIDRIITAMGDNLHRGKIPASPLGESRTEYPCSYCDYRTVCGFEDGDTFEIIDGGRFKTVLQEFREGKQ